MFKYNFLIKKSKAKEFIEENNKNVITEEFKQECKEASKLFKRDSVLIIPKELGDKLMEDIESTHINNELIDKCESMLKELLNRRKI